MQTYPVLPQAAPSERLAQTVGSAHAPMLRGSAPGENFVEFSQRDRTGAQLGAVLLTLDPPRGPRRALGAPARR